MGGVPKQKHTKSRRDKRRLHLFLKKPTLTLCLKCKKPVLPYTICLNCGYYQGKEIINVFKKLDKKERKRREKEIKEREKATKEKPLTMEELSKTKF